MFCIIGCFCLSVFFILSICVLYHRLFLFICVIDSLYLCFCIIGCYCLYVFLNTLSVFLYHRLFLFICVFEHSICVLYHRVFSVYDL